MEIQNYQYRKWSYHMCLLCEFTCSSLTNNYILYYWHVDINLFLITSSTSYVKVLFFSKPTAMLRGHNAPIFYLFIANDENRVFSLSTDKCIKVRTFSSYSIKKHIHINYFTKKFKSLEFLKVCIGYIFIQVDFVDIVFIYTATFSIAGVYDISVLIISTRQKDYCEDVDFEYQ